MLKLALVQKLEKRSEVDQVLVRVPCQLVDFVGYSPVYLLKGQLWVQVRWRVDRKVRSVVGFVEVMQAGVWIHSQ
jgi:hypothetical protein